MKSLLFLFAALPTLILAQAPSIEGTWQGTLQAPNRELRTVIKITKNGNALQGTLYSIDQAGQLAISAITLQGSTVKMTMPGIGGGYEGKLEADGNTITGTMTQGANPMPLPLKRATAETAWEIPPPPAPPKALPADAKLEFEVATIKPSPEGQQGIGINVNGNEFRTRNTRLTDLITFAWGIHAKQIIGLPGWGENDRFDILAPLPAAGMPSEPQLRKMMQSLILERFAVTFHNEKRELSVYTINIGKAGPSGVKLTKNESKQPLPGLGFQGRGRMRARNATLSDVAGLLQFMVLDRPVLDLSGLTDRYDLALNWTPDEFQFANGPPMPPAADATDAPPDLMTAFQEQLGLKLESTKAPADVFVIDKVSKPSEN
ncbi:MAG: TIGR03435 family protein [Acidobacteriota bacterium]